MAKYMHDLCISRGGWVWEKKIHFCAGQLAEHYPTKIQTC